MTRNSFCLIICADVLHFVLHDVSVRSGIPATCFWDLRFKPTSLTCILSPSWFPTENRNLEIILQVRPRPLLARFFQIRYSLIMPAHHTAGVVFWITGQTDEVSQVNIWEQTAKDSLKEDKVVSRPWWYVVGLKLRIHPLLTSSADGGQW